MGTLLGHIGKDKQADALVDKVLARFQGPGVLARNLVFCLNQVLSDPARLSSSPQAAVQTARVAAALPCLASH